jgi:hypothetical protein
MRTWLLSLKPKPKASEVPLREPCYLSVLSDCGQCSDACRASQTDWQHWLETHFRGHQPAKGATLALSESDAEWLRRDADRFGGRISVTKIPLALLTITSTHDDYWQLIGPKGRNMVRKAERSGYSFDLFHWNDRLDDIFTVNTSMTERGGKPMTAGYRERPTSISSEAYCTQHGRRYFGAFKNDTLVAYLVLVFCGHFAIINTILGHGDHLKNGIMNGLIDFMVRHLVHDGQICYVNYLTLRGGRETLDSFKKRVGFAEYEAVFLVGASHAK